MSNFWDVVWIIVITFVFVAYLFLLYYILTDIFRDRELSGWWKALWIILLILLPYLAALVYVIARGRGMTERTVAAATRARDETDSYITQVTGTTAGGQSPADQIALAKALLDSGTLSSAEFERLKSKALT